MSNDEFQQEIIDLLEEVFLEQFVDFNARRDSVFDIALHRNCLVNAEPNKHVIKICDLSDHGAVSLLLVCLQVDAKPIIENIRRFGKADYAQLNETMVTKPFKAICYSNVNRMSEEV